MPPTLSFSPSSLILPAVTAPRCGRGHANVALHATALQRLHPPPPQLPQLGPVQDIQCDDKQYCQHTAHCDGKLWERETRGEGEKEGKHTAKKLSHKSSRVPPLKLLELTLLCCCFHSRSSETCKNRLRYSGGNSNCERTGKNAWKNSWMASTVAAASGRLPRQEQQVSRISSPSLPPTPNPHPSLSLPPSQAHE